MAPWVSADGDGVIATWMERANDAHVVKFARMGADGSWSLPTEVARDPLLLANWADTPTVIRGGDRFLYAAFPVRSAEQAHAYDAVVARSTDGGATWSAAERLHGDETASEHGFVSLVPEKDGVRAFWLDGRAVPTGGPMTLRTAVVGESVSASALVDPRTCSCCNTSAAVMPSGVQVAYRDRAADREIRDITLVRSLDGGWSPTADSADGWEIAGCPVNGPAFASGAGAETSRHQAMAHFTMADGEPVVKLSLSSDGGQAWAPPLAVARADGAETPLGRVSAVRLGDEVLVIWLAERGALGVVRARRVARDGRVGPAVDLGFTTPDRKSGFPRAALSNDELLVVWTHAEGLSGVRVDPLWVPPPDRSAPQRETSRAVASMARPSRPAYTARKPDGTSVSLPTDKPVLVNLWATWCGPCVAELQDLATLHAAVGATVDFVGVAIDDRADRVERFSAPYPLVLDDGSAATAFGVTAVPTTMVYGREGTLLWSREGPITADDAELRDLLMSLP